MICLASAAMTHWLFAIVEAITTEHGFLGLVYNWELDWGPYQHIGEMGECFNRNVPNLNQECTKSDIGICQI